MLAHSLPHYYISTFFFTFNNIYDIIVSMAKITKQLKHAEFEYDEETKQFRVKDGDGNEVVLNKIYAFALMRFVIRMAQRNWLRSNKTIDELIEEDEERIEAEDPAQLTLF